MTSGVTPGSGPVLPGSAASDGSAGLATAPPVLIQNGPPVPIQNGPPPVAGPPAGQPAAPYPPFYPPYPPPPYPSPYPPPIWVPVGPPAPARAARISRATVVVLAIALIVAMVGVGGLTAYALRSGLFAAAPTWHVSVPQDPPPAADAPIAAWTAWARRAADDTVKGQARALLAGDKAGFTAIADPTDAKLADTLQRRFTVLRGLQPGVWTQTIGDFKSTTTRTWSADIKISYCFGDGACTPADLVETSRWAVRNDRVVLVGLTASGATQEGPRPWESDDLLVLHGDRVIIATTKINEYRLASAVTSADQAALIADTFAKWGPRPDRYVVFMAAPTEWERWYGGGAPAWAAGWTVPVGDTVSEVMVSTDQVGSRDLQSLLTHEFTHVTTLPGATTTSRTWWLVEGIAEYSTMLNKSLAGYDKIDPTTEYVHKTWDGHPDVGAPSTRASDAEAAARYGVAFLSVRRLAEKYTKDKMLDFFGRVVHDGADLDAAARAALGAPWTTVSADLTSAIRRYVG